MAVTRPPPAMGDSTLPIGRLIGPRFSPGSIALGDGVGGMLAHPAHARARIEVTLARVPHGLYHLSRPDWICCAAWAGCNVPFTTDAVTRQSSFSRLGWPRERIW